MSAASIDIDSLHATQYRVTVTDASTTTHDVGLTEEFRQQLTGDAATAEELLRASFEFLLEREPQGSILGRFDLPLIGSYFPEYEATMRERFGN